MCTNRPKLPAKERHNNAKRIIDPPVRARVIYFAAPLPIHGTPRYQQLLAKLRALRPGAELIEAATLFVSHADWRARWPIIRPTLHELVFITDIDLWIGCGVWREIADAEADGIPVWWLTDGGLVSLTFVEFSSPNEDDWRHYRRVRVARMRA